MADNGEPRNPHLETLDCLDARLVELDLLEQALNAGRNLTEYKLQRLQDLKARMKTIADSRPVQPQAATAGLAKALDMFGIALRDMTVKEMECAGKPPSAEYMQSGLHAELCRNDVETAASALLRAEREAGGNEARKHLYTASDIRWALNQALNGKTDMGIRQAIIEDVGDELARVTNTDKDKS